MEYSEVSKHLAPCGLDCIRCADCEQGEIKQLSSRLSQLKTNNAPIKYRPAKEKVLVLHL